MRTGQGEFGYINSQKKKKLIMIVVIFLIAVAIYIAGLLLNKMSRANIFTVLAVLCVLPWAKQVVVLVVFFPFQSVPEERYSHMKAVVDEMKTDRIKFYTDLVITSPDKVMNLDFLLIAGGRVVALAGRKGQDVAYIRNYLKKGVSSQGDYQVIVLEEEKAFEQELLKSRKKQNREQAAMESGKKEDENHHSENEEFDKVDAYICSLMV